MSDPSSNPELPEAFVESMASSLAEVIGPDGKPRTHVPGEHFISFRDVNISFDGRAVLENVSFYVDRGQTLCILGRSGVGKSVSLRMLMGFLTADSGSIEFDGQELVGLNEAGMNAVRKRITMVFQNGALFDSMSVRENVAFALRERGGL